MNYFTLLFFQGLFIYCFYSSLVDGTKLKHKIKFVKAWKATMEETPMINIKKAGQKKDWLNVRCQKVNHIPVRSFLHWY